MYRYHLFLYLIQQFCVLDSVLGPGGIASLFWHWYWALSLRSQTSTLQTGVSAQGGHSPSFFPTIHYQSITSDMRWCSEFCLRQDKECSHPLAVGRATANWWMVQKLKEVVTLPTNVVQKRKSTHEVHLAYLLLLYFPCFLPFVSYSHLFLFSNILICFTSSSMIARPHKEIFMSSIKLSVSSLLLVYIRLSVLESASNLPQAFCWDTSIKESSSFNCLLRTEELQNFIIITKDFSILLHLYLASLRCRRKTESHQNTCLWPPSTTCTRLRSSLQQKLSSDI